MFVMPTSTFDFVYLCMVDLAIFNQGHFKFVTPTSTPLTVASLYPRRCTEFMDTQYVYNANVNLLYLCMVDFVNFKDTVSF